MRRVYIVEDEQNLNQIIKVYLENEGYEVKTFDDGAKALNAISENPAIWVLDIMIPNVSGFELLKEIKKQDSTKPVIFISARDTDIDRILGLELGSDDYLTKPFSPKELVLRVNNLLKRTYTEKLKEEVQYGNYVINKTKRMVYLDNEVVDLTTKEFDLLILFLDNLNNPLSRDQIIVKVWDKEYNGSDRAVDDLVRRLRKKMPELIIEALYGFGYRMM